MIVRSARLVLLLGLTACFGTSSVPEPNPPAEVTPPANDAEGTPAVAAGEPELFQTSLTVEGLERCNECAMKTRVVVRQLPGIEKVSINLGDGTMVIVHDRQQSSAAAIADALSLSEWPTTVSESVAFVEPAPKPDDPGGTQTKPLVEIAPSPTENRGSPADEPGASNRTAPAPKSGGSNRSAPTEGATGGSNR